MSKTLCKSRKSKDGKKPTGDFTHVCRKCGRMASKKKKLCDPLKLSKSD